MKRCRRCHIEKPLEMFTTSKQNKDGRFSYCNTCQVERVQEWRSKNADKVQVQSEKRRARNHANHGRSHAETMKGLPYKEYKRRYDAMRNFGLTAEEYDALPQACLICGASERLFIDHCHASGKVRGRLCRNCNFGLGHFRDDPALLLRAIQYLNE